MNLEKFLICSCFPGFLIQISENFPLRTRRGEQALGRYDSENEQRTRRLRLRLIFRRGGNGFVFAIRL